MLPHSGPAGVEKFIRAYERAYLLELRAGLVLTHEVATAQRLFAYKEKLAPEVRAYLKGLPDVEQPISLAEMHRAVRKWAEIQREGQTNSNEGNWEHEYVEFLEGLGLRRGLSTPCVFWHETRHIRVVVRGDDFT